VNDGKLIYGLLIVLLTLVLGNVSLGTPFTSPIPNLSNGDGLLFVTATIPDHSGATPNNLKNIEDDSLPRSFHYRISKIKLITMSPNKDDTTKIGNKLNTLKEKVNSNIITRNLLSLLVDDEQTQVNQMNVNSAVYFEPYAGKKIASIRIKQLDVFGPTFRDTTLTATEWTAKAANGLHKKTVERKLRYQLLFNTGQTVQPELLAENEKIIRELPYIKDVDIILSPSKYLNDEVDILVITKERFEYGFVADIQPPVSEFEIYDDNIFGIGHQFSAKLVYHETYLPTWGSEFAYSLSDLGWKFVNGTAGFVNTYRKSGWNMALEKKFVSTDVKNAGGISFERAYRDQYVTPYNLDKMDTAVSYLNADYWYGHALSIHKKSSYWGNAIIFGRYYRQHYFTSYGISPNSMIRNHDFILSSLGFSKRNLFKNNLIYGYGITEDVPYGRYFEIASGIDLTTYGNHPYSHFLYSKAYIFKGGSYFNWLAGIGGFLQNSSLHQGAFKLNLNYFSKFIYINGNPYRNFINIDLLNGINRYDDEYLSINRKFGIRDFRSLVVRGTTRLKIKLESVRFLNLNYHGFRFAQYFFADGAFLSNSLNSLFRQDFYTGIGVGLRVHNESLVFKVFELRFTWFPIVPPHQNPYYFNAFTQSKTTFDDFLGRKPVEILYK
jgi:hypothetical protein